MITRMMMMMMVIMTILFVDVDGYGSGGDALRSGCGVFFPTIAMAMQVQYSYKAVRSTVVIQIKRIYNIITVVNAMQLQYNHNTST